MRRLAVLLALALSACSTTAFAIDPERVAVGTEAALRKETPHPVPARAAEETAWVDVFSWPGASYIAVHFAKFDLAKGERVEVRSPDGRYSYSFVGEGKPGLGGTFWATHVPGDTCEVRYYGSGRAPGFGYVVDKIAHGDPSMNAAPGGPEAVCGSDDSTWAKCYSATEPQIYDHSRAVVRMLINGTFACTAFLVGCQGHVLTTNHCIPTGTDAMNTDYELMAEGASCATNCSFVGSCPGTIVASTGTLIATESGRDYSLVQLPVNPTSTYGYFTLRGAGPTVGERIYLSSHPGGWGKRLAVTSTHPADTGGFCKVQSLSQPSCTGDAPPAIGYQCDTLGSSAGSPVVGYGDHSVVALHQCGNCPNRGLSSADIVTALGSLLPQCALRDTVGTITLDRDAYSCSASVGIRVADGSLVGQGTIGVTLASTREPATESVTLVETPASSGNFLGSFPTTSAPPVQGDGALSVANGNLITARYVDADDGHGGTNVPRTDTATVDCIAPSITSLRATDVTGNAAVISWTTNEPADTSVSYGASVPPGSVAALAELSLSHSVPLSGLTTCTPHFFSVRSVDAVGNSVTDDNAGSYYTFTTGQNTTPSFFSPDTPIAIPDNNTAGVTSTVNIPDAKTVLDANVTVNVSHSYDGELTLTLLSPTNTAIVLADHVGGAGDNFTNTVFDDEASAGISSGSAPFLGSFQPVSPLGAVDGSSAAGSWRLKVSDSAAGDSGSLLGWTLQLVYRPQSCGPHAAFESLSLQNDTCSSSGPGSHDGTVDAGEQIQFSVAVRNDGSSTLTGVTGTVVPLTPGVTMPDPSAAYNPIPVEGVGGSLAPHYTAQLPGSLSCGSAVNFQITVQTSQGNFTGVFSFVVGQVVTGPRTVLSEDFSGGIPAAWTVVDGGSGGDTAETWTTANPGSHTFTLPLLEPAAIVDSDFAGPSAVQDEQLITSVLDLATPVPAPTSVSLEFDQQFLHDADGLDEKGDVDVRSSLTGGSWVNVFRNQGVSSPNPDHVTLDISAQAAGASDVEIRFHYYDAQYESYWEVDNVLVTYQAPTSCTTTACVGPLAPGEVPQLFFTTKDSIGWMSVPNSTSYKLYRGIDVDLPRLMNASADSCLRTSTSNLSAVGLVEKPAARSFLWWLVRANNADGEGSAGNATAGARVEDSWGACP